MATFAQVLQSDGHLLVPFAAKHDVRLLWHCDYWDGPRSGMLEYREERCWFELISENDDPDLIQWYRRFAIIRLTSEQLAEEERWHELFRTNVGGHTDYDLDGREPGKGLRPREEWHRYYDFYRTRNPRDFSSNEVLAWFEH